MELLRVMNLSKKLVVNKTPFVILDDISFDVKERDFVCIVGPSGSGKSSLLRIIARLDTPTEGTAEFSDKLGKNVVVSMVFQSFALFPWLTVAENVGIGLEAMNVGKEERHGIVKKYIDIVGLNGFEDAYPKELSGGMKQRVSIARAISTSPELLLLDEPFAGLDVFSAQALREELLDLWLPPDKPPHAVLLVTHNVDEAVQLSDKIVILSRRPSTVIDEHPITLERPRNTRSDEFYQTVDEVVRTMSP